VAQAGPCGIWPEDIGPSFRRTYFENQPVWNHGCSTQRNLAAMVDDPADLVQPRGETPAYTMRRTTVLEKYRSGIAPATMVPDSNAGKISELGK
jgi:pilus assembly protein CpaD